MPEPPGDISPDQAQSTEYLDALTKWAADSAGVVRKAIERAKAESKTKPDQGTKSMACRVGREIVVNGEEFTLSNDYPILEQDDKVYYPTSLEAAEKLGFAIMYRRERRLLGRGPRVVHLANGNTSVAFWPESPTNYTVWDVQTQGESDRVEAFHAGGDSEIYYFDLRKVLEFAGGWVMTPAETSDGKYHIFIPWNTKGSWLRSCEMRGYTIEGGNITECPMGYWMVGSLWDYVTNRPGSDALDVVMVAQGILNRHFVGDGDDTLDFGGAMIRQGSRGVFMADRMTDAVAFRGIAYFNLSSVYRQRKQYREAIELLNQALVVFESQGASSRQAAQAHLDTAWWNLILGRPALARPHIDKVAEYVDANPDDSELVCDLLVQEAHYARETGDLARSSRSCQEFFTDKREGATDHHLGEVTWIIAENALDNGQLEMAKIFTNLALEYATRDNWPTLLNLVGDLRRRLTEMGVDMIPEEKKE